VLFLRLMESLRFIYLFNFMSFLLVPQFGRIAELDALYVRPKGEGQGWPESKERTEEKAPREPALRVRSLAWKIRAADKFLQDRRN